MARADDGVTLLSNNIAGEFLKARSSNEKSPWGVGGATGPPGAFGFIDSLFNLRVSVGLIVLAPSPEMWCAVDCRLLADEDGVWARCAEDLPGDRPWLRGIDPGSGVECDGIRCPDCCLEGGWSDFALAFRVAFGSLGIPAVVLTGMKFEESVSRLPPLFREGVRPIGSCELSPCNLDIPSELFVGSIPGPTLFRGGRAAGFWGAGAGNWLWRRVRIAMLEAGGGIVDASEAVDAMLGLRAVDWLKRRMNELLRVGRESVAAPPVNACMLGVLLLAGTGVLKLPGAGKSLRLGS